MHPLSTFFSGSYVRRFVSLSSRGRAGGLFEFGPLNRRMRPVTSSLSSPSCRSLTICSFDRLAVSFGSAFVAFWDPKRADMIALLGELTSSSALPLIRTRMLESASGRRILEERPRIRFSGSASGELALHGSASSLGSLPEGSFGHAYGQFLLRHDFSPEDRAEVKFVEDGELAYILQRYREVHDFWHVLADLPPSVPGEIAIKWLEMVQTGLPVAALSALVAPLRLTHAERSLLLNVYLPWAVKTGSSCAYLLSVPYEDLLGSPLSQVRKDLKFESCPS